VYRYLHAKNIEGFLGISSLEIEVLEEEDKRYVPLSFLDIMN